MSKKLDFEHIQFWGIESLEPPFTPDIREYTIHRKAGVDLRFQAMMNQPPGSNAWYQYPGFNLEVYQSFLDRKDEWRCGEVKGLGCSVNKHHLRISCNKAKHNEDENAQSVSLLFAVITEPMSEEEIKLCTHRKTHCSEGECWGGASGSSSVEIFTYCDDCGATLDKTYEYRD